MNRKQWGLSALLVSAVVALSGLAAYASTAASASSGSRAVTLVRHGTGTLRTSGSTSTVDGTSQEVSPAGALDENVPNSGNSASRVPSSHVPRPDAQAVSGTGSELLGGFEGLNHADQRFAGTGAYANTNFSLEPPDQGLCVGNGYVVEPINTALRVYSTDGVAQSVPVPLNQFFGLSPAIIRSSPLVFGDFTSDPKCIYDAANGGHFILSMLELDTNSANGHFTGPSHEYIAVSQTNSPLGSWNIYSFDVTNDGAVCPCFGDQPLLGADANGIYITTNSYPTLVDGFNGAQVYAFSKAKLESGTATSGVHVPVPVPAGFDGPPYSLQPAKTVPGAADATDTEYFLSALDFSATLDNRIAAWKLTGTSTLDSASPDLSLTGTVLDSEVYGQPPAAEQSSSGTFPLRDGLLGATVEQFLYGVQFDNRRFHTELLNSNDDRMNEVVFDGSKLYGAVNTVVKTPSGPTHSGIAWFVVDPSQSKVVNQGYLSATNENLLYPAFGVNADGKGAIGVTIVGTDRHPSTAYALYDGSGFGPLHVSFQGPVPDDGFTGYEALNNKQTRPSGTESVARWGDYAAAAVDSDGSIWLANESTSETRSAFANWGTFISHVQP